MGGASPHSRQQNHQLIMTLCFANKWCCGQIINPAGDYQIKEQTVSNGDHSFTAHADGKYTYCFGNQHWGANTKEVSFNVHGIVYVTESEGTADPLETEGISSAASPLMREIGILTLSNPISPQVI